ncbi:hypothetical protein AGRA3207_007330 [Actinomadura graeca]|uniref:Guanylate cyclase domain-containing protein n=1 Tax=Actinomadura graeca TaxID=2750812 RepID=A0ABX8R3X3_9ACTN|nr:hypothetical protein [Actinomadura graeca]QXJ25780.1 hypothetical protein AGRA3207_007330 [Actinomadura graeca]
MSRRAASPLQRLISCTDVQTGADCLDDARAALSLITTWSIRTGKSLPCAPIEQLSARQLEDFWADDSMLETRPAPSPQTSPPSRRPARGPLLSTRTFDQPSERPPTMHTTLIAVDIPCFGDLRRDADAQRYLRKHLYEHLQDAFEMSRLPWLASHREDRGDGALIVTPPQVCPTRSLDPLAHHLTALLRRSNRLASELGRIRLRMAVHCGVVEFDGHGVLGQPLTHLFRLLEAPAFKQHLAATDADLGMLVSQQLYHQAAASGRINTAAYRPLTIEHKETRTRGHLWLPPACTAGHRPRLDDPDRPPRPGLC